MKKNKTSGVGQPETFYLNAFGQLVYDAFGSPPYLVGSATHGKKWRDVDVRLILADDEWKLLGFGEPHNPGAKWVANCMAFSALGKHITGLPIDFQIQQQTDANIRFGGKREALLWIYERKAAGK
jgi:hypothetical protein